MESQSLRRVRPDELGVLELNWRGRALSRPLMIDEAQATIFSTWLRTLNEAGVPYSVGGAYAVYAFTGAWRNTKDLDVFIEPRHLRPALEALRRAGFETEIRDRLWLAKAYGNGFLLDLLFGIRRALKVTERWLASCVPAEFLGIPTCLLGPEEVIASKAYLVARDRFDGADIVHLIRALGGRVDWQKVIDLLRGDEEIIFYHLLLFQIVYPGHAEYLPDEFMRRMGEKMGAERKERGAPQEFRGMLLDPESFGIDSREWGYEDSRDLRPLVDADGAPL